MIIGIAGAKRAGKTTLAAALAAHYGATHTSFAAPLREFVATLLGFESVEDMDPVKEVGIDWLDGVTPRQMMQTLGTEWGRQQVHHDLWVRRALDRLDGNIVVSDVRFQNEADAIRERGGYIIRVTRAGTGLGCDAHVSERPLPDNSVDVEIVNDGTPYGMLCAALAGLSGNHLQN